MFGPDGGGSSGLVLHYPGRGDAAGHLLSLLEAPALAPVRARCLPAAADGGTPPPLVLTGFSKVPYLCLRPYLLLFCAGLYGGLYQRLYNKLRCSVFPGSPRAASS